MTTLRVIRDQVQNTLDYLLTADLALWANPVSMSDSRVSWHAATPTSPFSAYGEPTIDQYTSWTTDGQYSAVLFDGSLLQISYEVRNRSVVSHRLAFIPSPFDLDFDLLTSGEPLSDVIDLFRNDNPVLRSPIRFDFSPSQASPRHPASHLSLNSTSCRIACIAPLHVRRFVSFIFQQFYPRYWSAHERFFSAGDTWHLDPVSITPDEKRSIHIAWDHHATVSGTDWW